MSNTSTLQTFFPAKMRKSAIAVYTPSIPQGARANPVHTNTVELGPKITFLAQNRKHPTDS